MASEQDTKKRLGRKLTKKRNPQRNSTVKYPERLKEGDDVHEDVTAANGRPSQQLNQSVFSMIAAAGSKVDFHARFDDASSDSEEENKSPVPSYGPESHPAAGTYTYKGAGEPKKKSLLDEKLGSQHGQIPEHRAPKSLPKLNPRPIIDKSYMLESRHIALDDLPSSASSPMRATPRDAPVMSRMLEARAQMGASMGGLDTEMVHADLLGDSDNPYSHSNLVSRLKEIFEFEQPEEVISGMFEAFSSDKKTLLIDLQSIHAGFYKAFCFKDICTSPNTISAFMLTYRKNM